MLHTIALPANPKNYTASLCHMIIITSTSTNFNLNVSTEVLLAAAQVNWVAGDTLHVNTTSMPEVEWLSW